MTTTARVTTALLVGCVALPACSGDDDAMPSTTRASEPVVSTTDTTTTLTASTTTVTTSVLTVNRAAAEPSTSDPPATTEPSTATTEPQTDEDAVIAAYRAAYEAFFAAAQYPNDPELRRGVESTRSGEQLAFVTGRLDELALNDHAARVNPDVEDTLTIESVTVDRARAEIVVCIVDPWLIVRLDEEGPRVVNDAVGVYRERFQLARGPQGWTVYEGTRLDDLSEAGTCAT